MNPSYIAALEMALRELENSLLGMNTHYNYIVGK